MYKARPRNQRPSVNILLQLSMPAPCYICRQCGKLATTIAPSRGRVQRGACPTCGERHYVIAGSGVVRLEEEKRAA